MAFDHVCFTSFIKGCSPYDLPLTASLPDSNFNATSVLSASLNQPYMAKFHGSKEWCPATATPDAEFIQVDLSTPFRLCAVDTQGHHTLSTWFVSSYKIAYSLNGSTWFIAHQNETNLVSVIIVGDILAPFNNTRSQLNQGLRFFAAVNHVTGPLRKQNLRSTTDSKRHVCRL